MNGSDFAFRKMHGLGNDFVIFDFREGGALTPALARAVADRRRGLGCDQVVTLHADRHDSVAAKVIFWNADGSTSGACGNATRCVADLLMRESGEDALTLRTANGLLNCWDAGGGLITVDMGAPKLEWEQIPLADAMNTIRIDVKLGPIDNPWLWGPGAVNMGNPHAVFFVDDAEATPVDKLGPMIEHHPMFPERTNVEFCHIVDRAHIRMRVWERGAGVTQACGSGACAALVAAARRGLTGRRAMVTLDGGPLAIEWRESDDHVLMTGPVAYVAQGRLNAALIAAAERAES